MKINLQNLTKIKNLPTEKQFTKWVNLAIKKRSKKTQLGILIVNRAESAKLNHLYRQKKGPTNVLSFTFDTPANFKNNYLGDLVLCAPLVSQEARQQKKSLQAHWAHLIIHGVLHLLGYDHKKSKDAKIMEQLETDILAKLGYPDPYKEIA